ncbi:MAG: hypothetical protein ACRDP1_08360 [Nocardioidaceae bacterium]
MKLIRTVVVPLVAISAVGLAGTATAVAAPTLKPSNITAHPSTTTPAAHSQFVVTGRFTVAGHPAAGRDVKVQWHHAGRWTLLKGAIVKTGSNGTYRVRLIMWSLGKQTLRVMGVPPANAHRAFREFQVTIH